MNTFSFDVLYQKYVDEYSLISRYLKGFAEISQQDLLDNLAAEVEGIINDYGLLIDYADLEEPNTILEIYSIEEAQWMLAELTP